MTPSPRALWGAPLATAGGTWILWAAGRHLTTPPSPGIAELDRWYGQVGAGGAAAVAVWLVGLGLAAWLTVALSLQVLSGWVVGLRSLADAVSPAVLRRVGPAVASASLSVGLVAGGPTTTTADGLPTPGSVDEMPPGEGEVGSTATMTRLDPAGTPTTVAPSTTSTTTARPGPTGPDEPSTPTSQAPSTTTTTSAADRADGGGPDPAPAAPPPAAPAAVPVPVPAIPVPAPAAAPAPAPPPETIRVAPGMSFWSIAEEVLADEGRPTAERDVARYWRTLIDANLDRLVAAGNPDLLLPGQELVLPPR